MKLSPLRVVVLTLVSAGIALCLSLLAVIGTGDKDSLRIFSTVQLNASTILQHAVKLKTSPILKQRALDTSFLSIPLTNDTSIDSHKINHKKSLNDEINGVSNLLNSVVEPMATNIGAGMIPSPTDFTNQASSLLNSIVEPMATAIIPGIMSSPENIMNEFENAFKPTLNQFANSIGKGVDDVVALVIKDVVKTLGIKQWYGLYFGQFCSADYKPNYQDPKAILTGMKCQGVRDPLENTPPQNQMKIGPSTLDFSALNLPEKVTTISNQLTAGFRLIFGIEILAMISSGLTILFTPLLLISKFNVPPALIGLWGVASFSALCFFIMALIQTTVAIVVGGMINQLGYGLGLSAHSGGALLALSWASAISMIFGASILFVYWFNEIYTRRTHVRIYDKPVYEPEEKSEA